MPQIKVNVNMSMSGNGMRQFTVNTTDTIGSLKKMIKDSEGFQGVVLVFKTKTLSNDNHTLADIGCYNGCTFFCAARLLGGDHNHNYSEEKEGDCNTINQQDVVRFGGTVVSTACPLFMSEGCDSDEIKKARLPCGCVFCADCMRQRIHTLSLTSYCLRCGDCRHTNDLNIDLAFAVAGYTKQEANEKQVLLSRVFMGQVAKVCANQACQFYVFRDASMASVNRVRCPKCKSREFCYQCSQKWNNNGSHSVCGNTGCSPLANIQNLLLNCVMKTIGGIANIPEARLCPNKSCNALNYHDSKCKHMTCIHCQHQYCHSCLRKWGGAGGCSHSVTCTPAGTQTVTEDMSHANLR